VIVVIPVRGRLWEKVDAVLTAKALLGAIAIPKGKALQRLA